MKLFRTGLLFAVVALSCCFLSAADTQSSQTTVEHLLKQLQQHPNSLELLTQLRQQIQQSNDIDLLRKAVATLLPLAKANPNPLLVDETLALAFRDPDYNGQAGALIPAAIDAVKKPQLLSPQERKVYGKLLRYHARQLQWQGALDQQETLLGRFLTSPGTPEYRDALTLLAHTQSQALNNAAPRERTLWQKKLDDTVARLRADDDTLQDQADFDARAEFYWQMLRREDALRIARRAVAIRAHAPEAETLLCRALIQTRRYDDARSHAETLANRFPDNNDILILLGEARLRTGDWPGTIAAAQIVRNKEPKSFAALLLTSLALIRNGQLAEMRHLLEKEGSPELQMQVGMYIPSDPNADYSQSIQRLQNYEKKLGAKATDGLYLTMLSVAEQSRNQSLFLHCWDNMDRLGALKEATNANNIGYLAIEFAVRPAEAKKLIEYAVTQEPDNGTFLDSLAWFYEKQGDHANALKYIVRALDTVELDFARGVLWDHAGDIYLKNGNQAKARECYRQALGDAFSHELDFQALTAKLKALDAPVKSK